MPQVSTGGNASKDLMSPLAIKQTQILRAREEQYQRVFAPELFKQLQAAAAGAAGQASSPLLQGAVGAVNSGYQQGSKALAQGMAQRGLSGSGMEAGAMAALGSARTTALSDAYLKAQQAEQSRLAGLLQMGGAMSPTPTNAAPTTSSTDRAARVGWGALGAPSNA